MQSEENKKITAGMLLTDDSGVGVVEIILILVVLIALVVIFKSQLTSLVRTIFSGIRSGIDTIVQ